MSKLVHGLNYQKAAPADRARSVAIMLDLGINIIGGYCGTGPAPIKATQEVVDRFVDNGC